MSTLQLSPEGAPPTQAEILAAFAGVLAGTATREATAAWARARRDAPPMRGQFGALPHGRLLGSAFWALLASDVTEGTWTAAGPPYFMRDADIAAWAAALRDEPAPLVAPGQLQPLSAQEGRLAPMAVATLDVPARTLAARLGLQTLRGLDDLDFYEELVFHDPEGRQLLLSWRPRGPRPDEAELYLEADGGGWAPGLGEVLA